MKALSRKFIALSLAAILGPLANAPAQAQLLVYDPVNWIENASTALYQVYSYYKMVEQVQEAIKTNKSEQPMHEAFGDSIEMKEFLGLVQGASDMRYAAREGVQAFNDLQRVFGASKSENWAKFIADIGARKASGDKQATQLYDAAFAADEQIRKAYEANRRILGSLSGASGPTEALQAAVNSLAVVIDQNNTMLMTMSGNTKMQAQKVQKETQEREQHEKMQKKYRDKMREAFERDLGQINGMGGGGRD